MGTKRADRVMRWGTVFGVSVAVMLAVGADNPRPPATKPTTSTTGWSYPKLGKGVVPAFPLFNANRASTRAVVFVEMVEARRAADIAGFEKFIADDQVELAKRLRAIKDEAQRKQERDAFLSRKREHELALARLRENEPPYRPPMDQPLSVGSIGYLPLGKIEEIRSNTEMLIRFGVGGAFNNNRSILVRGVSTKGLVDKETISLPQVFEITETAKVYDTIFVAEPFTLSKP